jgi:hypothetical protein
VSERSGTDGSMVVSRIVVERHIMPDGSDQIWSTFDDGTDDGDVPPMVILLGMLSMARDVVLHGGLYDDRDDDDAA